MSQIHITLPSNSSMTYFPENTLTNYKTRLHLPLDLGYAGSWEVGISEMVFPRNWKNVKPGRVLPDPIKKGIEPIYPPHPGDYAITVFPERNAPDCRIFWLEPGHYTKVSDVARVFTKYVTPYGRIGWDKTQGHIKVTLHKNQFWILTEKLATLWGVDTEMWTPDKEEVTFEGKRIADTFPDIASLYVYCDLITHQLVGDARVPLLRIVPVTGKNGENVTVTFDNIQYRPVRGGTIQTIEVDIRDGTGDPIPFHTGQVVVTLHLRRARSQYFSV